MGKDPERSLKKLRRKLSRIEKKLKTQSRSPPNTRSRRSTPSPDPVRSRSRTRSRSRIRSCSPHEHTQDETYKTPTLVDENADLKENVEPIAIDLTEEPTATTEDVDSDMLELLGNCPQEIIYSPELLPSIVTRWEAILKKGLDKDDRKELLKKYPPPGNCKIINAPKINPEAQAASGENVLKRDKAMETKQQQVSCAISALGLALNKLCKSGTDIKESIGLISDAARLLCDYHHTESVTRKNFILSSLDKSTREGLKDTGIDEWLFGADFADKLKACKAIKKSGQDLRGTALKSKTSHNNTHLNSKGTTNNSFKPKTQNTHMKRPVKKYNNQTKNYQSASTQQSSFRNRQQNNHRRQ